MTRHESDIVSLEAFKERTALLESEQAQANALFLSIGEGAISTDEHGKINRINQVALDLLGFKEDELLGKWFPTAIIMVDENNTPIDISERPISKAFLTGHSVSEKLYYRRKDGSHFPVSLTVSPIMLGKKPIGAVEVFRDFTSELETERAKDEFIAIASHQLRTPLTAIRMYSEMLAHGYGGELTPDQKKYVEAVNVSIIRMATLIDSLLSVARIESGHVRVRPQKIDAANIMASILSELEPRMEEKSITIIVDIDQVKNLKSDPILVKELFANLLTNAIKYTPRNGNITISIKAQVSHVLCMVADTGYGIPKAEHKHIFSKFYRGSNIITRDTDGTGIGLYLVKRIVETLNGDIWFESKEHVGTKFIFTLPLSNVTAATRRRRVKN